MCLQLFECIRKAHNRENKRKSKLNTEKRYNGAAKNIIFSGLMYKNQGFFFSIKADNLRRF